MLHMALIAHPSSVKSHVSSGDAVSRSVCRTRGMQWGCPLAYSFREISPLLSIVRPYPAVFPCSWLTDNLFSGPIPASYASLTNLSRLYG